MAIVTRDVRLAPLLLALAAAAAPLAARAGETACWFDGGVVVVPAEVLGIAGDYVLDTATPVTQLADTQAQGAGFDATHVRGDIRLAGLTLRNRPVEVAKLDLRTGALPTPIAGVIGADLLKAFVLDVSITPCRVALRSPRRAPPFHAARVLPLAWIAGAPAAEAAVSDGPHAWRGAFALATGSDTPIRLSDALAAAPGAARPQELYPYGVLRPRLAAVSFAGALFRKVPAGLVASSDPALAGQIGAPLMAAWRLRFDFPRNRLELAPNPPSSRFPRHAKDRDP